MKPIRNKDSVTPCLFDLLAVNHRPKKFQDADLFVKPLFSLIKAIDLGLQKNLNFEEKFE